MLSTNIILTCEISGSHGGEYEVQSLLGYSAVYTNMPTSVSLPGIITQKTLNFILAAMRT
jgi:hypothetical protein